MREFVDLALSFPTVVFTVTTAIFFGFWTVTTLLGAGLDSFDFDFDSDVDLDLDVDIDVDVDTDIELDAEGAGLLISVLDFLGITGMPLLLAANLISLFSWFISIVLVTLLGGGTLAWLLSIPVLIASFLGGGFITGRIAKRFAHVFVSTQALRHRELVGSGCTITTQRVTGEFGQAEVRDGEGGSLIVQVRCPKDNDLTSGDRALIFDLDTDSGIFSVSPDKTLAP